MCGNASKRVSYKKIRTDLGVVDIDVLRDRTENPIAPQAHPTIQRNRRQDYRGVRSWCLSNWDISASQYDRLGVSVGICEYGH